MSDNKTKASKLLWLLLAFVVLGAVAYFMVCGKSSNDGASVPGVENPTDPQPGDLTPPDKTAEPIEIDPVEEATRVIEGQSLSLPGLELGMGAGEATNLIERLMKPETSEGNQTYNLRLTPQTENGYTLFAVAENMLDDSVKAQEVTAMFRPGQREAFVLSEYTIRVKCRRGANAGQWQTERCS